MLTLIPTRLPVGGNAVYIKQLNEKLQTCVYDATT